MKKKPIKTVRCAGCGSIFKMTMTESWPSTCSVCGGFIYGIRKGQKPIKAVRNGS